MARRGRVRGPVRWIVLFAAALLAVPFSGTATSVPTQPRAGTVTDFPLSILPADIAAGPDGALWFTNYYNPSGNDYPIGRITAAGVVTTYSDPAVSEAGNITAGPDAALWFTDRFGNSIERITTSGHFTRYTDPDISKPGDLTVGPDGALWFTNTATFDSNDPNADTGSIGRISLTGHVTRYRDAGIIDPDAIVAGPDGALWFTNSAGNSISRITIAGVITNFVDPNIKGPGDMTVGLDGALWFTNDLDNDYSIGRITTSGVVTAYTDPSISNPGGITRGFDGALWFTNFGSAPSIGRITTDGSITSYTDPNIENPRAMAAGSDGALWFTQVADNPDGGSIARISTSLTATPPATPSAVPGNGRATVHWAAPADSGGSTTTAYVVTPYLGDTAQKPQTFGPTRTTGTVTGLANGRVYRFKVAARNANGTGGWSDFTAGVRVGAPLAPTGVSAKKIAPGALRVAFSVPASNGSPITGFVATCRSLSTGRSKRTVGSVSPITLTGLGKGKTYACIVTANNRRGSGVPSSPAAAVTA